MMFRKYNKTMEPACLHPVTLKTYEQWFKEMGDAYTARVGQLALSSSTSRRRKRSVSFDPLDSDQFCATLIPEVEYQGVLPLAGVLSKSQICKCEEPSARYWKQIKYKVKYTENMEDPTTEDFRNLKAEVEEKVSVANVQVIIASYLKMEMTQHPA